MKHPLVIAIGLLPALYGVVSIISWGFFGFMMYPETEDPGRNGCMALSMCFLCLIGMIPAIASIAERLNK